jgi:hypothetical protein
MFLWNFFVFVGCGKRRKDEREGTKKATAFWRFFVPFCLKLFWPFECNFFVNEEGNGVEFDFGLN